MIENGLLERIAAVSERLRGALLLRMEIKFQHHLRLEFSAREEAPAGASLRHVELTFCELESVATSLLSVRGNYAFVELHILPDSPLLDARPVRTAVDGVPLVMPIVHHFKLRTDQGDCDFLAHDFTCFDLYGRAYG